MSIIGGLLTIILGLIGAFMMDVKRSLSRLWKSFSELNSLLLKDYVTKDDLQMLEKREELHYEQIRKRLHDLHDDVLSPLQLKMQTVLDGVQRLESRK
jgi:hypothetical protein